MSEPKRSRDPNKSTRYYERKAAGLCTTCGAPAADDRQQCDVHLAIARASRRRYITKRRRELRRKGLCLEGCGRKAARAGRCVLCLIATSRVQRGDLVGVDGGDTASEEERFRKHADGRTRYHGQMRRGRQPSAQLDDQDLKYAADAIEKAKLALQYTRTAEVQALPKYQRDAAKRAALGLVEHASRFLEEVLDRNGFVAGAAMRDGKR